VRHDNHPFPWRLLPIVDVPGSELDPGVVWFMRSCALCLHVCLVKAMSALPLRPVDALGLEGIFCHCARMVVITAGALVAFGWLP